MRTYTKLIETIQARQGAGCVWPCVGVKAAGMGGRDTAYPITAGLLPQAQNRFGGY